MQPLSYLSALLYPGQCIETYQTEPVAHSPPPIRGPVSDTSVLQQSRSHIVLSDRDSASSGMHNLCDQWPKRASGCEKAYTSLDSWIATDSNSKRIRWLLVRRRLSLKN